MFNTSANIARIVDTGTKVLPFMISGLVKSVLSFAFIYVSSLLISKYALMYG